MKKFYTVKNHQRTGVSYRLHEPRVAYVATRTGFLAALVNYRRLKEETERRQRHFIAVKIR